MSIKTTIDHKHSRELEVLQSAGLHTREKPLAVAESKYVMSFGGWGNGMSTYEVVRLHRA